jgi:hypothetical protein
MVVQHYNLFRIKGRSDLHLKLEIVKYIMTGLAIFLTYKSGIFALLYGQIAVAIITHVIVSQVAGKLLNYSLVDQLKALFPIAAVSSAMGLVMYFVGTLNITSNLVKFTAQILSGIGIYILINAIIKSPELSEYRSIVVNLTKTLYPKVKNLLCKHH